MESTSQGSDWSEYFKAIISCLSGEINKLSSENGELKTKLIEKDQIVDKVVEKSDDLAQQLEAAKREIGELKRENEELKSKLEKKEQTVDKAVEQSDHFRHKFDESQKEVGKLKSQIDESNGRASKALEQSDDLQKENDALKSELAKTQRDKKVSEDQLGQAYNDNINKLNAGFSELTQKFATKCQEHQELDKQIKLFEDQRNRIVDDLYNQGSEKYDNGHYQESLELYSKAMGIEETGRKDLYWLGLLWNDISASWFGLKRYEKALEAIEKAIVYNPSVAIRFHNRGNYHQMLGHIGKAIADYKKSLEIDPNHSLAKAGLARLEKK